MTLSLSSLQNINLESNTELMVVSGPDQIVNGKARHRYILLDQWAPKLCCT